MCCSTQSAGSVRLCCTSDATCLQVDSNANPASTEDTDIPALHIFKVPLSELGKNCVQTLMICTHAAHREECYFKAATCAAWCTHVTAFMMQYISPTVPIVVFSFSQ
jgi:hypothetical protein